MTYMLFLIVILGAAFLLFSKRSQGNFGSESKASINKDASPVYVPLFSGEPDRFIPHSEAVMMLGRAREKNPGMNARDLSNHLYAEVASRNMEFIGLERVRYRDLLSDVDGKALDQQQCTAVLTDEDAELVIAGAGSGKTTCLAGKVLYLTKAKGIDPNDILLLSFTNKAADEMTDRICGRMGIPIAASTFHKLGLDIIRSVSDTPVRVHEDTAGFIRDFFDKALSDRTFQYPYFAQDMLEFFSFYLHPPADMENFSSLGEAFEYELCNDFETLRSRVERAEFIETETASRMPTRKTLRGECVKSLQELLICNFLFLHGVEYEYERPYPIKDDEWDGRHTAYKPDFYLPDYDIWIEHFGIDRFGRCPWLIPVEEAKYQESMIWKRELHKKHGTVLLETYSWYVTDGILLSRLETMLRGHGVKFSDRDYEEIFRTVYGSVADRYFSEFISLCSTFLSLFKANGYTSQDLSFLEYKDSKYACNRYHTDRTRLFLNIMEPVLTAYDKFLWEQNAVDFSDMINIATKYIQEGKCRPSYKYILVDEYQDASIARFKLVKALHESCGAKILCVGDDWQSIFRFSGSDISVFTDFEEMFEYAAVCKIEQTYRNSQQLINCASDFVMKNPKQISKNLVSAKQLQRPIVFINYEGGATAALKEAMDRIIRDNGPDASILLLGRTRYDLDTVRDSELFSVGRNSLKYLDSPDTPVRFLTIHSAKGLEADSVIVLNFNNELLGFPNKISDDVLLQLVLSSADSFIYAEERRLLYVALTRTKTKTYVLTNSVVPSEFYKEFENSTYCEYMSVDGVEAQHIPCPRCRTGHLVIRQGEGSPFLGCSLYPQCNYTVSDISILKRRHAQCSCGGFFIRRTGRDGYFYGCSNYPHCQRTLTEEEYARLES